MSEVLYRYRFVIITLSLLLFAALLWLMLSKRETVNIPSRGVFVIHGIACNRQKAMGLDAPETFIETRIG